MMTDNLLPFLRLIRSPKVGPMTFWQLLQKYGDAGEALKRIEGPVCSQEQAEGEIEAHHRGNFQLISYWDKRFPDLLKQIPDCPPMLSIYGQPETLNRQALAIVGGRNASLAGRTFAEGLSLDLSTRQVVVVSGMARGIDRHAHLGALKGAGTIAVLAGGIDVIYPEDNHDIYKDIYKTGCVISEMPLGMRPAAQHFPRRNRLISGLSIGTIVVEAALQSGSLITARLALEQGRDLFAVPSSPLDPRGMGSNQLLKTGAHLVTHWSDVLDVLPMFNTHAIKRAADQAPQSQVQSKEKSAILEELHHCLLTDLSSIPIHIDLLAQKYGCPVAELLESVLELELQGLVIRDSSGNLVRCFKDR